MAIRGGCWDNTSAAGLAALVVNNLRSHSYNGELL